MTVLFGLAIGSSIGIYSMMPLYLIAEQGTERGWRTRWSACRGSR